MMPFDWLRCLPALSPINEDWRVTPGRRRKCWSIFGCDNRVSILFLGTILRFIDGLEKKKRERHRRYLLRWLSSISILYLDNMITKYSLYWIVRNRFHKFNASEDLIVISNEISQLVVFVLISGIQIIQDGHTYASIPSLRIRTS